MSFPTEKSWCWGTELSNCVVLVGVSSHLKTLKQVSDTWVSLLESNNQTIPAQKHSGKRANMPCSVNFKII